MQHEWLMSDDTTMTVADATLLSISLLLGSYPSHGHDAFSKALKLHTRHDMWRDSSCRCLSVQDGCTKACHSVPMHYHMHWSCHWSCHVHLSELRLECRGCEKVDAQIKVVGIDAKTYHLDFFGVPVKAAETLMFVNGMRLLARKVWLGFISTTNHMYSLIFVQSELAC